MKNEVNNQNTEMFKAIKIDEQTIKKGLKEIIEGLEKNGYDVKAQLAGFLITGDPTYLTREVRTVLRSDMRFEILEYILNVYIQKD